MKITSWLFPKKSAAKSDEAAGCLFGLTPPEGFYFRVEMYQGQAWFVHIMPNGKRHTCDAIARACELVEDGSSDKRMILAAAREALSRALRVLGTKELEGDYPPKRVGTSA